MISHSTVSKTGLRHHNRGAQRSAQLVRFRFVERTWLWRATATGTRVWMLMLLLLVNLLSVPARRRFLARPSEFRHSHHSDPCSKRGGVLQSPPRICKYFTARFCSSGFLDAATFVNAADRRVLPLSFILGVDRSNAHDGGARKRCIATRVALTIW